MSCIIESISIRNEVTQSTILQIFSAARLSKNNNNAYSSVRKVVPSWGTNLITGIIFFLPGIFIGLPGFFTRDCRNRIVFTRDYFTRDFRRATGWIKLSGIICTRDFRTPIGFTRDCHNPRKNYDGNVHHLLAVNSDHHRLEL